jgi:hypothetical protein
MNGIHSGQGSPLGLDFSMIRLESGVSDCPMGMSFWGEGVNTSYTPGMAQILINQGGFRG